MHHIRNFCLLGIILIKRRLFVCRCKQILRLSKFRHDGRICLIYNLCATSTGVPKELLKGVLEQMSTFKLTNKQLLKSFKQYKYLLFCSLNDITLT